MDTVEVNQGVADVTTRKPWLAGLLGGLAIGLGHVYVGRCRRAIILVIISLVIVYPGLLLSFELFDGLVGILVPLLLFAVLLGYSVGNALSIARNVGPTYRITWYNTWYIYAVFWLLSVLVVPDGIRSMFIEGYRIPSGSMEDTLLTGDFLLADKFRFGPVIPYIGIQLPSMSCPQPNDIVVFQNPKNPSVSFVDRCVAVGGQTVEIRDKVVYVDGQIVPLPVYAKFTHADKLMPKSGGPRDNFGPYRVPDGHYFMMGDNRDDSYDSRYYGAVPGEYVLGKAFVIYFSVAGDTFPNMRIREDRIGLPLP